LTSPEVELLKETAELRQFLTRIEEEKKKKDIRKQIQEKQIEFNMIMERQKRNWKKLKEKQAV
jgi:hypothetical protein